MYVNKLNTYYTFRYFYPIYSPYWFMCIWPPYSIDSYKTSINIPSSTSWLAINLLRFYLSCLSFAFIFQIYFHSIWNSSLIVLCFFVLFFCLFFKHFKDAPRLYLVLIVSGEKSAINTALCDHSFFFSYFYPLVFISLMVFSQSTS